MLSSWEMVGEKVGQRWQRAGSSWQTQWPMSQLPFEGQGWGAKWADVHPGLPGMQANSLMLRKNILKHFVHTICDAEYIKYWWNVPQQQYYVAWHRDTGSIMVTRAHVLTSITSCTFQFKYEVYSLADELKDLSGDFLGTRVQGICSVSSFF